MNGNRGSFDFESLSADVQLSSQGRVMGILGQILIPLATLATQTWTEILLPGFGNSLWLPRWYYQESSGQNQNDANQVIAVRLNNTNAPAVLVSRVQDYVNTINTPIGRLWVKGIAPAVGPNTWKDMILMFGVNVTLLTSNQQAGSGDGQSVLGYVPGAGAGTAGSNGSSIPFRSHGTL